MERMRPEICQMISRTSFVPKSPWSVRSSAIAGATMNIATTQNQRHPIIDVLDTAKEERELSSQRLLNHHLIRLDHPRFAFEVVLTRVPGFGPVAAVLIGGSLWGFSGFTLGFLWMEPCRKRSKIPPAVRMGRTP